MKARDIMAKPVTVSGDAPVVRIRTLVSRNKIKEVVVVEAGKPIGGITLDELLNVTSRRSNLEGKGIAKSLRVIVAPEDLSLDVAKQLVAASEKWAPVMESGKLIGVVDTAILLSSFLKKGYKPVRRTVGDVMQKNPLTVDCQSDLEGAWWKLKNITGLPVMKKKELVGILTRADVIRHGKARFVRESAGRTKATAPVERIMTTPAITVSPSTTVEEAAAMATSRDFSMIPVVESKKLVGVISQYDMLKAYVR